MRICLWSRMCPCRVGYAEWAHVCCQGKLQGLYGTVPIPPGRELSDCSLAWVVLYRGTLGRPPFHGRDMIGPGLKIRLFDTALTLRYTGFEQPTLYAELGGPLYRENGYHFFGLTPHLCVVTGSFLPICLDRVVSYHYPGRTHLPCFQTKHSSVYGYHWAAGQGRRTLCVSSLARMGEGPWLEASRMVQDRAMDEG
jgi:hypothetical protein